MNIVFDKKGYIRELLIDDENIIHPWGIECGDSAGFFSMTEKGWRCKKHTMIKKINSSFLLTTTDVQMPEGSYQIVSQDKIMKNKITRSAQLRAKDDTFLMDFVLRFRFKKNHISCAKINGQKILHKNSNTYYQYPVDSVFLEGRKFTIKIKIKNIVEENLMTPYMYVRDYKDEWIVHCRLLPKYPEKEIIKLNTFWYNKSIPSCLSRLLLKSDRIKKALWYRTEKKPYPRWNLILRKLIRPCAYALSKIPKNAILNISAEMTLEQKQKWT